jgi:hypothetical protein
LKKQAGSVRFYNQKTEKTKPNRTETEKNRKKTEPNQKNRAKPEKLSQTDLNRFLP